MADDSIRLESERDRNNDIFRSQGDGYVPLAVGAALVFHQAHGNTRAIVDRRDYDDALNLAAAALSRLITVYARIDPQIGHTPLRIDLVTQRFTRGATRLHIGDGTDIAQLYVQRGELVSALSLVRRVGIPFRLVFPGLEFEAQREEAPPVRSEPETRR